MSRHEPETPTDGETVPVSDQKYPSAALIADADLRVSIDTSRTHTAVIEDDDLERTVEVWGSGEHALVDLVAEDDATHANAAVRLSADEARHLADGLEQLADAIASE